MDAKGAVRIGVRCAQIHHSDQLNSRALTQHVLSCAQEGVETVPLKGGGEVDVEVARLPPYSGVEGEIDTHLLVSPRNRPGSLTAPSNSACRRILAWKVRTPASRKKRTCLLIKLIDCTPHFPAALTLDCFRGLHCVSSPCSSPCPRDTAAGSAACPFPHLLNPRLRQRGANFFEHTA